MSFPWPLRSGCHILGMHPVTTALHQAINDKFREHGISIPYPQRDLHLSAAQPLDVRLRHA